MLLVRTKAFLRAALARWEAFVYQDDLMPDDLKDELANFFVALMTALFVGAIIIRVFFARH